MLLPERSYQLSATGQTVPSQYVPKLQNLQNAKVVIYGYAGNPPVDLALQRAGSGDNTDLFSRRADNVVAYSTSQRVNPQCHICKGVRRHAPRRL